MSHLKGFTLNWLVVFIQMYVSVCSVELEKKLRTRADREHLVQKNILPGNHRAPVFKLVFENETQSFVYQS